MLQQHTAESLKISDSEQSSLIQMVTMTILQMITLSVIDDDHEYDKVMLLTDFKSKYTTHYKGYTGTALSRDLHCIVQKQTQITF